MWRAESLTERRNLQFKPSAFNVSSTPIFDFLNRTPTSPLFGVVPIAQIKLPRSVELGFCYVFWLRASDCRLRIGHGSGIGNCTRSSYGGFPGFHDNRERRDDVLQD